jgi:hypothetical protein
MWVQDDYKLILQMFLNIQKLVVIISGKHTYKHILECDNINKPSILK